MTCKAATTANKRKMASWSCGKQLWQINFVYFHLFLKNFNILSLKNFDFDFDFENVDF